MNCIICDQICDNSKDFVKKPTTKGLRSILESAEKQFNVPKNVLRLKDAISNGQTNFHFHVSCRRSLITKQNIKPHQSSDEPGTSGLSSCRQIKNTRSNNYSFDVRKMCLFCDRQGKKKKEKLTSIQTGTGESTRRKILDAAEKRGDLKMTARCANYEDLFACDAKYHKSCYGQFISKRNIDSQSSKGGNGHKDGTLENLVNHVRKHVLEMRQVLPLSILLQKYNDENELVDKRPIKSNRLKNLLKKSFLGDITFVSQPGKTDLIHATGLDIKTFLTAVNEGDSSSTTSSTEDQASLKLNLSDKAVLHRAAEILRANISMLANKRKTVPLISEISEETFESQVPDLLLLFSSWVIYNEDYSSGDHIHALTLSNIIQSFCQKSCSNNLQIGLGLYLYNNVRSKKVIDLLHNMGVSCSYNDIRSLITSLAKNAVKTENHIYVPYGIQSVDQEKKNYIHSSIDNFDLNEETLSGKDTTHSMALVVFQEKLEDLDVDGKIPKESKYSLSMEDVDIPFQKIERYYNPNKRPEPDRLDNLQCSTTEHEYSRKVNFVWRFLRHLDKEKPFLGWTEYHDVLSTSSVKVAQIAYLPFLNNPPTDCDTIYTSMLRLVELAEHLNQHHIIITADLAIYSKAQEILWNKPARLDGKVTLQLGGMHLCLAFLASIGFLYKDSGLYDMLVETEIYAPNTCKQILEGKHYSRSIRSLILTSDALTRLLIDSFYEWMEKEPLDEEVLSHDILQDLKDGKFRKSALDTYLNALNPLFEKMKEFENIGSKSSPTFCYWLSFLDSVNLLLDYQSAERNGSFQLHLKCVFEMLPYLKAGGRHLYAKWVPIYLKDMNQLKLTQPEMYDYLERGNFVVKKTNEKTFNCVASDMALEQSINRDCKSSSGVVGFTRKPTALLRWMMTRHIVGSYSQNFEVIYCNHTQSRGASISLRNRNEQDVMKIYSQTKQDWCNPFDLTDAPEKLINICTGRIASPDIEKSLTGFLKNSKISTETFIKTVLINGSKSFWEPIKKDKVLTFAEVKTKNSSLIPKKYIGSEVMFRRIVAAAKFKDLDLSDILSYELTSVPVCLFHDDETMRKTSKADLAAKLEPFGKEDYRQKMDSIIIDGMVQIQELSEKLFETFNDLALLLLRNVLGYARKFGALRTTIVFDRYDGKSIKAGERRRRGDSKDVPTYEVSGNKRVIKFRNFLRNSSNKRSLLKFVCNYFLENAESYLQGYETFIIAGGFENPDLCFSVTKQNGALNLHDLECNHEEADTRIIVHTLYEQKIHQENILIKSVDTDVFVLLIHYCNESEKIDNNLLFIELGHGNKKRIICVTKVVQNLGSDYCKCLLSLHALTGCDTTSAFFKIGKKTAFDIARKNFEVFKSLPDITNLPSTVAVGIATRCVLTLFRNKNPQVKCLNNLRHVLTLDTNKSASELPPTDDAFEQHVLRCIYQLKLWTACQTNKIDYLDPTKYGWIESKDGVLDPVLTTKDPIPLYLRKLLSISCKDKLCDNRRCVCLKESVKCCLECACVNCRNCLPNLSDVQDEREEDAEEQTEEEQV